MPNGKSLYSTFAGASAAEGKSQAAETARKSIRDLMKGELQIKDWEQGETQKAIGAVSEGLSLASTLYGGWEAKQEFETAKTGVQSQIAKESYTGEDYKSFIGTTEGQEYLESFAPEKTWSFKEGTKYKFGEGEDRYSLGKAAISGIGEGAQYGVKADLSMYKEAGQAAAPPAVKKTSPVGSADDVVEEVAAPAVDWGDDPKQEQPAYEPPEAAYGSKENPFVAKGVKDVFKLAKQAGMKPSGQTLYSKWGKGDVMSWEYKFGE